jgi:hypothetical protein
LNEKLTNKEHYFWKKHFIIDVSANSVAIFKEFSSFIFYFFVVFAWHSEALSAMSAEHEC